MQKVISEQNGTEWIIEKTNQHGIRAFWISKSLMTAQSLAKPNIIGFYAASVNDAIKQLNNQ